MTSSVVLPRRVVPQPVPFLDARQAGDCGACVLAGLLDCTVQDVYELYLPSRSGFTYQSMRQAIWTAYSKGFFDRIMEDAPLYPLSSYGQTWGLPSSAMSTPWFRYVRMAFDAGYYGLAEVNFAQKGYPHRTDHFVLLCGARERRILLSEGTSRIEQEVLVSCSAQSSPEEEWVEVDLFLRTRGGYNAFFVRPTLAKKITQGEHYGENSKN